MAQSLRQIVDFYSETRGANEMWLEAVANAALDRAATLCRAQAQLRTRDSQTCNALAADIEKLKL